MAEKQTKLVFFIIDGCSSFYLKEQTLPGLEAVIKNGLNTKYATPVFPSMSLTNFYTMFTGLYPEQHQMLSNELYDYELKQKFHILTCHEASDAWFESDVVPLWIKAGQSGVQTSIYWPWFINFNAPKSCGPHLHYWEEHSAFMDQHGKPEFESWMESKLDRIVEQLKEPLSQFIVIYWPTLDTTSHKHGPRAPETIAELKLVDRMLANFQKKLEAAQLLSTVNLLVAADHGQLHVPEENRIMVDKYVDVPTMFKDTAAICEGEACLLVYPVPGKEEEMYQLFVNSKAPHVTVRRNKDMPDELRVKKGKHAPPIWVCADPGYSILESSIPPEKIDIGVHGYDSSCEDMRAVCIGRGPGFASQTVKDLMQDKCISTIDYHTIMSRLLGLAK